MKSTPAGVVRTTHLGRVRGSSHAGVLSWKGIPFAQPPVGALRWQPPQEPEAWSTIRDTKEFGAACAFLGSAPINLKAPPA